VRNPHVDGAIQTIRAQWRPFVAIQLCLASATAAYYLSPAVARVAEDVARWKAAGGLPLSAVTTAFAGIVLPCVARSLTRMPNPPLGVLAYLSGYFALAGVLADLFYKLLAVVIGPGTDGVTVATKVVVDQLGYSPFVATPYSLGVLFLPRVGFDFGRWRRGVVPFIRARTVPTLALNWMFWVPSLVAIYALPTSLQFVLFLFAQAGWSLLLTGMKQE
jgi:hypothetical protein